MIYKDELPPKHISESDLGEEQPVVAFVNGLLKNRLRMATTPQDVGDIVDQIQHFSKDEAVQSVGYRTLYKWLLMKEDTFRVMYLT